MREIRAVHPRFSGELIEALGWVGFQVLADWVRNAAEDAGWPDAETVSECLEWRDMVTWYEGSMILAIFEVMDR